VNEWVEDHKNRAVMYRNATPTAGARGHVRTRHGPGDSWYSAVTACIPSQRKDAVDCRNSWSLWCQAGRCTAVIVCTNCWQLSYLTVLFQLQVLCSVGYVMDDSGCTRLLPWTIWRSLLVKTERNHEKWVSPCGGLANILATSHVHVL
jgi:hypothetical protein